MKKQNTNQFHIRDVAEEMEAETPFAEQIIHEAKLFDKLQVWVTRVAILVFFLILNVCLFGQKQYRSLYKSGGGASVLVSANGHGAMLAPYVHINQGGKILSVSPLIQLISGELQGYKLAYSLNLSGNRQG